MSSQDRALTLEQMAAKIEQSHDYGCDFDDGRFRVRIDPVNESLIEVDDMEWEATIYSGRSAAAAALAISAERNR